MTFNKTDYWNRRHQGLRGQGDYPLTELISKPMPAAPNRRKLRDGRFTKRGFTQVLKVENGQKRWIPTQVGSRLHKTAQRNTANRTSARGE